MLAFPNLPGFMDEKFSDVTVVVSYKDFETKCYKLHRNVLAGCSEILHDLLQHHQTLEIPFMSPEQFELLIMYMYAGEVCFKSVQELCSGQCVAKLYRMENLLNKCSERLVEMLTEDGRNALLLLDERFNCLSDNAALFDLVDEVIRRDYRQILRSQVIQEIEMSTLKHLLQMEYVSGVPEIEVFRALLRWTEARCCKYGIERVPQNLQEVAGDLIYQIRFNLIPVDILETEVAQSGLVSTSLIGIVFKRCFNVEIEVPFCTRPRERIVLLDQEEWQLASKCSREQHSLQRIGRWTINTTLSWGGEVGDTVWFPLPTSIFTNTEWEVRFYRRSDDDFDIGVRCVSLDRKFRAAEIRLVAVVEEAPQVWGEAAAVLECGKLSWGCWFCKKVTECPKARPIKMRVTAHWTELEHLPPNRELWIKSAARIQCSWQLRGWKAATPSAERWGLRSEPFGRNGALWCIQVWNYYNRGKRELQIGVLLQHLPASVEWSGMSWKCSLKVWSRKFDEKQKNMEWGSCCEWTVVEDINVETRDPLDLVVVIHVSRKD